jgi:hypothetical protein
LLRSIHRELSRSLSPGRAGRFTLAAHRVARDCPAWYSRNVTDVAALVVLSTFPDAETAARVARTLVDERLAACVNLVPAIRSIDREGAFPLPLDRHGRSIHPRRASHRAAPRT